MSLVWCKYTKVHFLHHIIHHFLVCIYSTWTSGSRINNCLFLPEVCWCLWKRDASRSSFWVAESENCWGWRALFITSSNALIRAQSPGQVGQECVQAVFKHPQEWSLHDCWEQPVPAPPLIRYLHTLWQGPLTLCFSRLEQSELSACAGVSDVPGLSSALWPFPCPALEPGAAGVTHQLSRTERSLASTCWQHFSQSTCACW